MPVSTQLVAKFSAGAVGSGAAVANAKGDFSIKALYRCAGKALGTELLLPELNGAEDVADATAGAGAGVETPRSEGAFAGSGTVKTPS
jgi:hypothetical protein